MNAPANPTAKGMDFEPIATRARGYDPNLRMLFPTHRVRVTLRCWQYKRVLMADVGGNTLGSSVLEAAVDFAYDHLEEDEKGRPFVELRRGLNTLRCQNEDYDHPRSRSWFNDMVVGVEIVSIRKGSKS